MLHVSMQTIRGRLTFGALLFGLLSASAEGPRGYNSRLLVSDLPGVGQTDRHLVNPWGVAFGSEGYVWVADNEAGVATAYDGAGEPEAPAVAIPGGGPTGIVFNPTTDFEVTPGHPARFLFATLNGTIAGWSPDVDLTHAMALAQADAAYTGLALAGDGEHHMLFAADFAGAKVDVFDEHFAPVHSTGAFVDPHADEGYAPFGIQALLGSVYVTYALQDRKGDEEVTGPGLGFVSVFAADGTFLRRVASHGELNAPWALALAPADFGAERGQLLVGNFGDGRILALDPRTGEFEGALKDSAGNPIVMEGLWGMAFGNGDEEQPTGDLFFAAGIDDEEHGVYGRLSALTPGVGGG